MSYYVEVILPLPLDQKFTYFVSDQEFDFIKPGMRIIVPFGKSKFLTAIAHSVHQEFEGLFELKSIHQIIDNKPVVNEDQLKFWDWISKYYMCPIGDVLKAALPSNLLLQSETVISINPTATIIKSDLNDNEYLLIDALEINNQLSVDQASAIIAKGNVFKIIHTLSEKGFLLIEEKTYSKYSVKYAKYVRLKHSIKQKNIYELINKSINQKLFYEHYKQLKMNSNDDIKISEFKLIKSSYISTLKIMEQKGIFEIFEKEVKRNITLGNSKFKKIVLSKLQNKALEEINLKFKKNNIVLFKGVTSSGKTEIYISLIKKYLKQSNQILFLVPEIALTTQLVSRLSKFFSENLLVYHSGLNINQRAELWNELISTNNTKIIIGARSSIYLPFTNLKLIIVDEEHEVSYKQFDPSPRYNARDASIILSNIHGANILLGTATPSLESYFNAKITKKFSYVELNQRYKNIPMPKIQLVDMLEKKNNQKKYGLFSDILLKKIKLSYKEGNQIILFQNRRGYSPVLECNDCHHVPRCVNCDVSLTLHLSKNSLKCHYCGFEEKSIDNCIKCGSRDLISKGFGTEQVELELKDFFPDLRIARLDYDTTRGKNSYKTIIQSFENLKFDVLIGTQMVTKGLDFKNVSLVGIMNIDNSLNFPDFRSYERCFQLVQQVSGRSGRSSEKGEVIIQTNNLNNQILQKIIYGKEADFYHEQILDRESFKYPPYVKLIKITFKHQNINKVNSSSQCFYNRVFPHFKSNILGPEFPFISRIRNKYLKSLLIKVPEDYSLSGVKNIIKKSINSLHSISEFRSVRIIVDVDPY